MSNALADQVKELVEEVVIDAMDDDFKEAMKPFEGQLSSQMESMIHTVFESGVRVGASRILGQLATGRKLLK